MDHELEARYGPISDQFWAVGERGFRQRERDLVHALCDGVPRVVATGGGAWMDPGSRLVLKQHYVTVVLTAPLRELARRVGRAPHRPLWGPEVDALFHSRQEAYRDAHYHVETYGLDVTEVVDTIWSLLNGEARR